MKKTNFEKRTVGLLALIAALCLLFNLTACSFTFPDTEHGTGIDPDEYANYESAFPELDLFDTIFQTFSVYDLDRQALVTAVLKSYAQATGDLYAEYYTAEEYAEMLSDNNGEMVGIGVSVVNTTTVVNGYTYSTMTIISVFENSPALNAGIQVGDLIYAVTDADGNRVTVEELGYTAAINCVRGEEGTEAKITVLRPSAGSYVTKEFSITRAPFVSESVTGRVYAADSKIGVVKISQFDLTTPTQFCAIMDDLIAKGCERFIFDVRNNPGGDLQSIEAVLSTFLQQDDVMIYVVSKDGTKEYDAVEPVQYSGSYAGCSVKKSDIGKYREYPFAVIANEYTASAAELFTSNLRDYDLATIVGTKTFGKGCMQSIFDLNRYGVEGAVKLTTAWYLPPCGEGYHGIGIYPTEGYEIELPEELVEEYENVYLIPDEKDPQLEAAVRAVNVR